MKNRIFNLLAVDVLQAGIATSSNHEYGFQLFGSSLLGYPKYQEASLMLAFVIFGWIPFGTLALTSFCFLEAKRFCNTEIHICN